MRCRETPLSFECEGASLAGILTEPEIAVEAGVVVVVGGPQYRVGSHRQFVLLARALAAAGIACLRFDYRGMGDSEGDVRTFETVDADVGAAVEAFVRKTGLAKVVLWGLCDGASAAMMYAPADPRIAGVIAVNPWARSEQGEGSVRLRHYYVERLLSRVFWRKLFAGDLSIRRSARDLAREVRKASTAVSPVSYLERMQTCWASFSKPMLFILSGNDFTAREFRNWVAGAPARRSLLARAQCESWTIDEADHTFSRREWSARVADRTIDWILRSS